jgi:hypothetical protein
MLLGERMMPGRKQTFFVVQLPRGVGPRAWGQRFSGLYGFDYDTAARAATELLLWPNEIPASTLSRTLRAAGVPFRTFQGDPDKMFNVTG